jgi:hypothetical protein
MVWSPLEDKTVEYVCEIKIPLWKALDKEFTEQIKEMNVQSNENLMNIEDRHIKLRDKIYSHHNYIGSCEISLELKNEKLIEQKKYCSRTEIGIVNTRPTALDKNIKSNSKTIH